MNHTFRNICVILILHNYQENTDVVNWRGRSCQTRDTKWLVLEKIYEKLHRPHFYDIGNTFINDVLDYSFTTKIENIGSIFLLHLFVTNRHEGSFTIAVNEGNDIKVDKRMAKPSSLQSRKNTN